MKGKDITIKGGELYFIPIETRIPLKFGSGIVTHVTCARVRLDVVGEAGSATGWGEVPLSVQWVWPSEVPYEIRADALEELHVLPRHLCPRSTEVIDDLVQFLSTY